MVIVYDFVNLKEPLYIYEQQWLTVFHCQLYIAGIAASSATASAGVSPYGRSQPALVGGEAGKSG